MTAVTANRISQFKLQEKKRKFIMRNDMKIRIFWVKCKFNVINDGAPPVKPVKNI